MAFTAEERRMVMAAVAEMLKTPPPEYEVTVTVEDPRDIMADSVPQSLFERKYNGERVITIERKRIEIHATRGVRTIGG